MMRRAPPLAIAASRGVAVGAVLLLLTSGVGCGGGGPLLHPARTLAQGDVRVASGVSANVVTASLGDDLKVAKDAASKDPLGVPGPPGSNPAYAKGALVAAAVAPGLAPFVSARVGVGRGFEGGLAYTGRGARVDLRRGFDDGRMSYSLGLGLSVALLGRQQGSDLPNVDLASLHGYGADIPLLVGWESAGGIYKLWGGARGGFEHDVLETVSSEPKATNETPFRLEADRFWGGAVLGLATGFRHLHVALELSAAYQVVKGSYYENNVTIRGLTLAPATALWWTF